MSQLNLFIGKSVARIAWNPAGKMIFDGQLNLEIPKTGRMVRSGYASVMSPVSIKYEEIRTNEEDHTIEYDQIENTKLETFSCIFLNYLLSC